MFWGYTNLARHLGCDQPVYAFQSRGLDGQKEFDRIEEMAAQYVTDLRVAQPHGPYYLGGYCFGGNVAYEMARLLEAGGEEVAMLALLNCAPPNSTYTRVKWTPAMVFKFLKNLRHWAGYFFSWSSAQKREFVRWKWRSVCRRVARLLGRNGARGAPVDAEELVDLSSFEPVQRQLWEAHIRALFQYTPQPYRGSVTLFRSPGHQILCSFDPRYGWGDLAAGGVTVRIVPGAHESILEEPHVAAVARELSTCLQERFQRANRRENP
jgi:thioesterase domain-containing protein